VVAVQFRQRATKKARKRSLFTAAVRLTKPFLMLHSDQCAVPDGARRQRQQRRTRCRAHGSRVVFET
jgi:hypothetical protein